jgi:CBS domain-containing protein
MRQRRFSALGSRFHCNLHECRCSLQEPVHQTAKGTPMKIQDVMSSDVHVIDAAATVQEAAVMMRKRDIGSIPISREGVLVGMVTDRDIVLRVVADGQDCETPVSAAMSDGVKYCFEDETVDDVARRMSDLAIRRLPVLDRDKRVVGIVSLSNIASANDAGATKDLLHGIASPH